MTNTTDEQLIEAHQAGDEQALTVLEDRYRERVIQFLARSGVAADMAEGIFRKFRENAQWFDTTKLFYRWLWPTCANAADAAIGARKNPSLAAGV